MLATGMYHKSNYQTVSDQLTCAVKLKKTKTKKKQNKTKKNIYAELTQIDP